MDTVGNHSSAIMPSINAPASLNSCIRQFSKLDITIEKDQVLGHGMFGRCFLGSVGPLPACIKVVKAKNPYKLSFYAEANILFDCCHTSISFLHGVCVERTNPILILSLHLMNNRSCTLHSVLTDSSINTCISRVQWKTIITTAMSGLNYLHDKSILHNDIKEDNILLDDVGEEMKAIIIDFGKACLEVNGKSYCLSASDKQKYRSKHPQISPDVVDGVRHQDKLSDIYSFGRILSILAEKVLQIPALSSISTECLNYSASDRPDTKDLYTFLTNLLQ